MQKIQEQLMEVGFSEYEAQVYSALVQHSPSSATAIAKSCGYARSTVYTILNTLIAQGLVATTHKNNIKQFIAQDAQSIEQILQKERKVLVQRFEALEQLKISMKELSNTSLHVPKVVFFEGQEGLKKAYVSMMRDARKEDVLYLLRDEFVWQPDWQFIFESDWHDRIKQYKVEKNIHTQLLINDSDIERNQKKTYTSKRGLEYRFIPKEHSISQFAIYILGDVVNILSIEQHNLIGVNITNKHIANNLVQMFLGLWEVSKTDGKK
jgi:sugar-specific transcriptional regulator TrmB